MYSQLRTQYPTASLTSDLLVAQPSHYVVQAVIKIGESALATGLSAASTVEVAEDQARARALMVLGISVQEFTPDVQILDHPTPEQKSPPAQLNPAAQAAMAVPEAPSETWDEDWDWPHDETVPKVNGSGNLDIRSTESVAQMASESEDLPRPTSSSGQGRRKSSPKPGGKSTKGRRTQRAEEMAPPGPIDLSDIIAQSDIELRRLGWSHAEGRRFLEDTYGKRSRQQLTDSELLEFLEYLKVQSPAQDQPF